MRLGLTRAKETVSELIKNLDSEEDAGNRAETDEEKLLRARLVLLEKALAELSG